MDFEFEDFQADIQNDIHREQQQALRREDGIANRQADESWRAEFEATETADL
jgi:hypothetical protein